MMNRAIILIFLSLLLAGTVYAGEFFLKQTLFEGESEQYDVGGYVYNIKLLSVFDTKMQAQFEVNGEKTDFLSEDESHKLSDGAVIQVRDIMPQEAGDGLDLVQYNFFPAEHPEGATSGVAASQTEQVSAGPTAAPSATITTADQPEESAKEVSAAPAQEAKIDITKKQSTDSWWESLIKWLKNLFS